MQGDCKFCSASHFGIDVIKWAADLLLTDQSLLVGYLIVLMAMHTNYLSTITLCASIYQKLLLIFLLSQPCQRFKTHSGLLIMKILHVGLVILRFNKPNIKQSHWW